MKQFIAATVLLICVVGVLTGCTVLNGSSKPQRVLDYMHARYDDSFTCLGSFGGTEFLVSSAKYPGKEICVMEYKGSSAGFTDNYLDYQYEDEAADAIQTMLEETFDCPVVLTYKVMEQSLPCDLPADCSLDAYLRGRDVPFVFYTVISPAYNPAEEEAVEQLILSLFREYDMDISATFYFPASQELFDRLFTGEQQKVTKGKRLSINISGGQIKNSHWSEVNEESD